MKRLRFVFALVALGLAVPGSLLVARALRSVSVERQVRHRAVAERVFDEMERTLSEFIEAEDARPPSDYQAPSPLVESPAQPFVMVWFRVDSGGRVSTPQRAVTLRAQHGVAIAKTFFGEVGKAREGLAGFAQVPGSTLGYGKARSAASSGARTPTAYEALRALNRGVAQRSDRERKVLVPPKPARARGRAKLATPETPSARQPLAPGEARDLFEEKRGVETSALPEAQGLAGTALGRPSARTLEEGALERGVAPHKSERRNPVARLPAEVVDPLIGHRSLDASGHAFLVLARTVWQRGVAHRQGLVVDTAALQAFLAERTLAGAGLPGATLAPAQPGSPPPTARAATPFAYRHRFAEPFDALAMDLHLPQLGGAPGPATVAALSLALAAAAAVGLLALYRMVAVALRYAERRNNFVAAVSHELKTPLTAIRMYAEMLRDDLVPSSEKRLEYAASITSESERLTRLIDNVLEFSRLEQGRRETVENVGDVGPRVAEAVELMRPHVEEQGMSLQVEIAPDLPSVRFDPDALQQVLFNLVDNALKYAKGSDPPRIELVCAPTRLSGGGLGVALRIRDHGPGVGRRHLSHLFEPFYRGESEHTRRTRGTGIGLALVKGLAAEMGARVEAANAELGGFEAAVLLAPPRSR